MSPSDDIDTLQLGPDPDKLERYHRQQLSAMLDGELPQDQARFLRRRLQHDAELSHCFERWQVCGDVLRGRQVSLLPPDFADRIAAGIAADGIAAAPATAARRPGLLRWGGGAALAASVALLALFVGRPGALQDDADDARARPLADVAASVEPPVTDATADASAMLATQELDAGLAGTAIIAASDVARRSGERTTRSQQQRAALRGAQARDTQRAVALGGHVPSGSDVLIHSAGLRSSLPAPVGLTGADVGARPWPKASSLSADSSFSVRYGDGFAAPSWSEPAVVGSSVLPSFPVDPADAGASPQLP